MMRELLSIESETWRKELGSIEDYFKTYGQRMPKELLDEKKRILNELNS
jgi:phosphoenolpyruvate carboxykinase (GTP)